MLALPRADYLEKYLVFSFLDNCERRNERLPQQLHERLGFAQVTKRFVEGSGQPKWQVVRTAGDRVRGLEVFDHPQISTGQRGSDSDIRIGIRAADTVLYPPRIRAGHRHAQTRRAIVITPVNVDRS